MSRVTSIGLRLADRFVAGAFTRVDEGRVAARLAGLLGEPVPARVPERVRSS